MAVVCWCSHRKVQRIVPIIVYTSYQQSQNHHAKDVDEHNYLRMAIVLLDRFSFSYVMSLGLLLKRQAQRHRPNDHQGQGTLPYRGGRVELFPRGHCQHHLENQQEELKGIHRKRDILTIKKSMNISPLFILTTELILFFLLNRYPSCCAI